MALAAPSAVMKRDSPAPLIVPRGVEIIEDSYIVRLKPKKAGFISAAMSTYGSKADYTFKKTMNGFAATLTKEELAELRDSVEVDYIEQNGIITAYGLQEDAPWGLSRIGNPEQTGDSNKFWYPDEAGEGVCVYVVDTGIDTGHEDFGGRAVWGKNFIDKDDSDGNGHGTHVAGTIGGGEFGVAKKATLIAVKVLAANGSGTMSAMIAGMEYVADDQDHDCPKGKVANGSLGGSFSQSTNDAADNIIDSGVFFAVAAGNEGADADTKSPASARKVCTVGATDSEDKLASFSNVGAGVDILAPGVDIVSAQAGGGSNKKSGTSMAAPHVAGAAAVAMSIGNSAEGLCEKIASTAFKDKIADVPEGTVNLLLRTV
jgi:subtilisin family serine protease